MVRRSGERDERGLGRNAGARPGIAGGGRGRTPHPPGTRCRVGGSAVAALAAQSGQADAGGVETAIHRQNLAGDVAGAFAAQEEDGLRQFLFQGRSGSAGWHRDNRRGFPWNAPPWPWRCPPGRGRRAFTRMPSPPSSTAICLVRWARPPCWCRRRCAGSRRSRPELEVMFTTAPPPCSRHQRHRRLGALEGAAEVHRQDAGPFLFRWSP